MPNKVSSKGRSASGRKKVTKKKTSSGRPTRTVRVAHKSKVALRSSRQLDDLKTNPKNKSLRDARKSLSKNNARAIIQDSSRAKAPRAGASLSASVYDTKGKAVGRISLPSEIFGAEENKHLIAQAVRVYLANQRLGTVSMKTRGEVRGSTRKIYRQKGTGRARHGGIRAPIFVGGGVTFASKPRDFSLFLPQKMKRKALFSALSGKLKDGEIKVMDLDKIAPKTKIMAKALKALEVGRKILLVTPGGSKDFNNVYMASRNLKGMRISPAAILNTYDVLDNNVVIFMKDSIDILKKHFLAHPPLARQGK